MATNYAVWVCNHLPRVDTGLCPNKMWSQSQTAHDNLRRTHVWGCPVYVLEPELQDGKKIPKWQPRARLNMFVGFSDVHSSLVPLVLNMATGNLSPQYHIIFDDKFSTVNLLPAEDSLETQWTSIFKLQQECCLDLEYDEEGKLIAEDMPKLDADWLSPNTRGRHILPRLTTSVLEGASSIDTTQVPGGAPLC